MVTADCKHGKCQLALRHELLIVDRVLCKRCKLPTESVMNSAWPGI